MSNTIEDLLNALSGKKEKKTSGNEHKNVVEYIKELKIESGLVQVPNYVIFHHYRTKWRFDNNYNRKKAKKATFFMTFHKYFPTTRTENQRFYLLKEGIFDMSETNLQEAKRYDKENWSKKQPTKKASEQVQLSLSKLDEE